MATAEQVLDLNARLTELTGNFNATAQIVTDQQNEIRRLTLELGNAKVDFDRMTEICRQADGRIRVLEAKPLVTSSNDREK